MKMLMYEGFTDKLLPRYRLANLFVKFLNSVDSSLRCRLIEKSDGIWIKSTEGMLINIGKKYNAYPDEFGGPVKMIGITFFHNMDDNICVFLLNVFDADVISFDVEVEYIDIDELSEAITKENYEIFLLKKDADKYNL